ncbi:MAG: histidine kinase [Actinobacteria bacterium]|nr:histidine kinase [Actinomycetota bacterium]
MTVVRRSLWDEPRPPYAPPVSRLDRLLVGVLVVVALVEGVARPGLAGQPLVTALAMALMPVLLWRRSRPLLACLIGWGAAGLLSILQIASGSADSGLLSLMVILVLLYSLVRWGSGREVTVGLVAVALVATLGMYAASASLAEVVGGGLFLLLFVALGAVFRYRASLWHRQEREVRNEERLALARELHDTVAHHISAIAVSAQAGRVLVRGQPERAAALLASIEDEASRTLAEMRDMVRLLRDDEGGGAAAYAPQRGVADLTALTRPAGTPAVAVRLAGALTGLPRPVDATLYRLAQEGLTNALRHARGATTVVIEVCRVGEEVHLRVTDDGASAPGPRAEPGLGLTGMAERARLLGGSVTAGPGPEGGWVVDAVMPARITP